MTTVQPVHKFMPVAQFPWYLSSIQRLKNPQFVVLHATGLPTRKMRNESSVTDLDWLGNQWTYDTQVMHWSAGPHLFVTDRGIGLNTPLWLAGVGSPDWNGLGIIHFETCGNWTTEAWDGTPTKTNALTALASLFRWLNLPVTTDTLRFHYEDSAGYGHPHGTTHLDCPCHPGGNLKKAVLVDEIKAIMASQTGVSR